MSTSGSRVTISFEANATDLESGLRRVQGQLGTFNRTLTSHERTTARSATATESLSKKTGLLASSLGSAARNAVALGAAYIGISQAKAAIEGTQTLAFNAQQLHRNLGLAVKTASEWEAVAQSRNIAPTSLNMAFKTLSTQIQGVESGSATSIATFKSLGITEQQLAATHGDFGAQLQLVAKGLGDASGGADRMSAASKLLGRGYQAVLPLFAEGNKSLRENLVASDKLGATITKKQLPAQEKLHASVLRSKMAWQGLQNTFSVAVTPELTKLSDQFQHIQQIISDPKLTEDQKFSKVAHILETDFDGAINAVLDHLPDIADRVGEEAPKVAQAFVEGFLHADIWGKLAIGAFLISKMGGWSAIGSLGKAIGARIGGGILAGEAAGGAGGLVFDGAEGAAGGAAGASLLGTVGVGAAAAAIPFAAGVGIDKLGIFDSGGPLSHVPGAGLLGIGGHSATSQFQAAEKAAAALDKLKRAAGGLASSAPKDIRAVSTAMNDLASQGVSAGTTASGTIDGLKRQYGSFAAAGHQMSAKQRMAWVDFAQTAFDNGQITQKQLLALTNSFNDNGRKWQAMMQRAADATGESTKQVKSDVGDMTVKVSHDYSGMVEVTGHGLDMLVSNTNQVLKGFGAQAVHFEVQSIRNRSSQGIGGHLNNQRGGPIPGVGAGDTVPSMLEPGEGVINREAVKALGGPKAIHAINKTWPRFQRGGMAGMIAEANKFEAQHFPYLWGGGHSHFGIEPVDCSGAVSDVLHAGGLLSAPMTSGQLMSWGKPGKGALTVYASPVHTVMSLMGRFFGTSNSNPGGGAGWIEGGNPSLVSGGVARTMDVGALQALKRIILSGPSGALRREGQGSLDKAWRAAKARINRAIPKGILGGGDVGQAVAALPGGWKRVGATYEGLAGGTGYQGDTIGGMNFAELLVAGANAGLRSADLAATLGLPNGTYGMPNHTGILIRRPGDKRAFEITKNDIGSGQAGNPYYKVDLQDAIANVLGGKTTQDVEVKKLQRGGVAVMPPYAGSFANGGLVPGPEGAARTVIAHGGEYIGKGAGVHIENANFIDPLDAQAFADELAFRLAHA